MTIIRKLALAAAATFVLASAAFADTIKGLDGRWEGALDTGAGKLHVVIRVRTDAAGTTAVMDSPDQGVSDLKTADLTLKDGAVGFEIPSVQGRYDGKLSADGKTVSGSWSQGGLALPLDLVLQPGGAMTAAGATPSPAVKGLDGKWSGALEVGQTLHVELKIATDKAGTTASFTVPEQGMSRSVKSVSRDGQKVKVVVAGDAATFEGDLSADGKSIAGQFKQQGNDFPLTLTHQ